MARIARVVAAGYPHLVTQRGNRRQPTFFSDADYQAYLELMAESCRLHGVKVLAYCLMPNHVHLVAVPREAESLAHAFGEAHRTYTRAINLREDWRGYLWEGRFASCPMDARHALAAARHIELNPVRVSLVRKAWNWPWSSAAAHVSREDDALVQVAPLLAEVRSWRVFLRGKEDEAEVAAMRMHTRTGRPLGDVRLVRRLERRLGRTLAPRRPGRPRKDA